MRLTKGRKIALIIGITLAASSGAIVASSLNSADPDGSAAGATAGPSDDSSVLPISPDATAAPSTEPGAATPGPSTTARTASAPRTDRRYETCAQVIDAGLGPYKKDRDPEYRWYVDDDGDGWVCERSPRVHYRNCAEVRAAGAAPLHRGEPGYGRHLDRDGDGIACD